jgi:hypothetical protein
MFDSRYRSPVATDDDDDDDDDKGKSYVITKSLSLSFSPTTTGHTSDAERIMGCHHFNTIVSAATSWAKPFRNVCMRCCK